jgi:hypothetical protein
MVISERDLVGNSSGDLVNPDKPIVDTKKTTAKRAPSRGTNAAKLDAIKPSLTSGWVMIGGGIALAFPLTGKTMIYQAEELTDSLVTWGKTSPRIAKILLTSGKAGGAFGFFGSVAPVAVALMVELRTISPDLAKNILPEELHQFIPIPREQEWPAGEGSPARNGGEGQGR